jgi:hypothetical protein
MSNGSGSQYVVFKIWAAPFDSIAKNVTRHRHYLERLETNSNSVTLGTCVLGSVPSHEVRECVDAAGERAALNPTSAIWENPGRERFFTATENRSRPRFPDFPGPVHQPVFYTFPQNVRVLMPATSTCQPVCPLAPLAPLAPLGRPPGPPSPPSPPTPAVPFAPLGPGREGASAPPPAPPLPAVPETPPSPP